MTESWISISVTQPKCEITDCDCKRRRVGTMHIERYVQGNSFWCLTECEEFDTCYVEKWVKVGRDDH